MAVSYVGSTNNYASSTSRSGTPHASTQVGDFVLAAWWVDGGTPDTQTLGNGFTLIQKVRFNSSDAILLAYKFMQSAEDITSYTFSNSATRAMTLSLNTFSGVDSTTPWSSNANKYSQGITSAKIDPLVRAHVDNSLYVQFQFAVGTNIPSGAFATDLTNHFNYASGSSTYGKIALSTKSTNAGLIGTNNDGIATINILNYTLILNASTPTYTTTEVAIVNEYHIYNENWSDNVNTHLALPPHQSGDVILYLHNSDAKSGDTEFSVSTSGWTQQYFAETNRAWRNIRNLEDCGIVYKVATSSSETPAEAIKVGAADSALRLSCFVLRNVNTTLFTKGGISSCFEEVALSVANTLTGTTIAPEADNALLLSWSFVPNGTVNAKAANGWTMPIEKCPTAADPEVQQCYKIITSFQDELPTMQWNMTTSDIEIYNLILVIPFNGANFTPRMRLLDYDYNGAGSSIDLTAYVHIARHFTYPTFSLWAIATNGAGEQTRTLSRTWTAPSGRTWHWYGLHGIDLYSDTLFHVSPVGSDDASTTFTYSNANYPSYGRLYSIVGVNVDFPISDFQLDRNLNFIASYTPKVTSIGNSNQTQIMFSSDSALDGSSFSSGFINVANPIDTDLKLRLAQKRYPVGGLTSGNITFNSNSSTNFGSFILNPYGLPQKSLAPCLRTQMINGDTTTAARLIYNTPLKAGDVVVFFGFTRGTSAQLNFATSLGTATDLLTKWDSANGWNTYIKAIKITSPVTSSWSVTQSVEVGAGYKKYVLALVFENVQDNLSSISAFEAVDNTSNTTINLPISSFGSLGYAVYLVQANASNPGDHDWAIADKLSVGGGIPEQGTFFNHPEPTSSPLTITTTTAGKQYVNAVTLSGWLFPPVLFFGTHF